MKFNTPPVAIVVTLPASSFIEQNHSAYLIDITSQKDNAEMLWYRVCKNLPKHDILYVYTVINNMVHHRANFAGIVRNKDLQFTLDSGEIKEFKNANAILTCTPIIIAPHEIYIRGFQGFRYLQNELF
ncbi:MAG: hypothetical protein EAZ35_02360 [Sphingobacteriia bacterium]|nr:MAG: hypothetical protein EAZ35_02360 [Sphingobacteriia bacterium]